MFFSSQQASRWHPHIEYKAGEMVPDVGELEPNAGDNNEGQVQPSKK